MTGIEQALNEIVAEATTEARRSSGLTVEYIGHAKFSEVLWDDVNMPNMNGLDMLAKLEQGGKLGSLRIVMLTTESQPELLLQAKRAGAKGWIVKPFKPEMLLAAVRKLVGDAA